jgi:hypothetical protein
VAPPTKFMQMVDASKDEASLAVRLYNDPSEPRSFEAFVVHMHLAWLYLLHAELTRAGVDFRYWTTAGKVRRLIKVDGEPRQWELAPASRSGGRTRRSRSGRTSGSSSGSATRSSIGTPVSRRR